MKAISPILGRTVEVDVTQWSSGPWEIVQCRETGLVFLLNPPDYQTLQADFAWEVTSELEAQRRREAEPVVQAISEQYKTIRRRFARKRTKLFHLLEKAIASVPRDQPVTVMDVGCGTGHLLRKFHPLFAEAGRKIIPCGIEISDQLAERADAIFQPLGGSVIKAPAIEALMQCDDSSVDAIVMSSYLEHEIRPLDVLLAARKALKPGGSVIIKVPNFNSWNRKVRGQRWCGFRFPDHVNYFTPETLRILAEAAQLDWWRQAWNDRLIFSDNMYVVLKAPMNKVQTQPSRRVA